MKLFKRRLLISLPGYSEDIQIPGLTEQVKILRDSFAIPHFYARNESDLYNAVGYSMTQDRMWQMDLLRRVTQGRIFELMGKDQLITWRTAIIPTLFHLKMLKHMPGTG